MLTTLNNAKEIRSFYLQLMEALHKFSIALENAIGLYRFNLQNSQPAILVLCESELTTRQIITSLEVLHFEKALTQSPLLDSPKKRNEDGIRNEIRKKISTIEMLVSAFPVYFAKYPAPQPTKEIARWLEETE